MRLSHCAARQRAGSVESHLHFTPEMKVEPPLARRRASATRAQETWGDP